MIKKLLTIVCFLFSFNFIGAQSFRVEDVKNMFGKGNPFKLSGGFSANSVANMGSMNSGRDPFVYYLNGNVNLNLYGLVDMPFSFYLTNSGSSYKLPSSPNRLSIHPSYKWATAHIGDVSMSFSPYTLNGHIFTGVGVELTPSDWEFAAMYGRLQKAVEFDEAGSNYLPTYKRMGYGFKVGKNGESYRVSMNVFNARDEKKSLVLPPDSFGITPMQNLASSITVTYKPVRFIEIGAEYGLSLLTSDIRALEEDRSGILGVWSGANMSSTYYNAIKAHIDYVGGSNRFGIGYERIDPNYATLGAYYFVNDLENITFNAYQSFWQNKMNASLSVGFEHDDLENKKATASSRVVSSLNVNIIPNERINASLSYSNFQTYANVKSNFELINQENQMDKLDTLNFVQLSQSVNLNLNIVIKKTEKQIQNMNLNVSYQDAASKQGGVYHPGSVTEMINASSAYTLSFSESGLSFNGAVNFNNSKLQNENTITWGPTLGMSSRLFKKKVNLGGSFSYNSGHLKGIKQNEIFATKINSSYSPYQKQNITLSYNFQWRSIVNRESTNNSLIMAGYSYSF